MNPPHFSSSGLLSASVILDALVEGVLLIDQKCRVAWINRSLERLLGIERNTIHGSDVSRFVRQHLAPCIVDEACTDWIAASLSTQDTSIEFACTILPPDGRERRFLVSGTAVEDEPFRGMRVVRFQDITGQKQTEEILRESEEKYHTLFESAGDALLIHDLDGRLLDVNRATVERLGYSREELLAMNLTEIVPPEFAALVSGRIGKVTEIGHMVFETAHVTRDGRHIPIEASARVIPYRGRTAILSISRDITGRKRAEEAVQQSEKLYHSIATNFPGAVYVFDRDLRFAVAEGQVLEQIHWSKDSLEGRRVQDLDEETARILEPRYRRVLAGETLAFETPYRGRTFLSRYVPIMDDRGEVRFGMVIGLDITDRKRAEAALQESEERFRLLTENASDIVFVLDAEGFISYASPSVRQVGGHAPEELIGRRVTELVHPDDLTLVLDSLSDALARPGERISLEVRVRHRSGDWLYLDLACINLLNEPTIRGFVVNARDITERKRAEEALRESEHRFRLMGETVPYGVWFCAPDGGVRYCSQSFLDLLNMTQEEQQEFGWTERLVPDDVEPMMTRWLGCCATGTPWEHEHRITDRHGKIHTILSKGLPVRDAAGAITCWVGVNLDITDRKRAEEALRQSEQSLAAELDAARRLQQVSTQLIQADRVEALYEQILDTAVTILHADFASIQILYAERGTAGELRLLGHRGFTEEAARFWEWVRPDSGSPCGKALSTGQRVIVPDVQDCEFLAGSVDREVLLQTGIRAVQTTPLYSRPGTLLGMLSTHWCQPHEPTANELRSVDLLARQAADLIDRKRADDALRRHTDDLVRKSEELEAARDTANMYLDIMTHDVRNANNVSSMYADLLVEMAKGDLKKYTEKLHASIHRSSEILQNVATLRRAQEETGLVPVNLDAVIREEIATFPGAAIRYTDPEVSVLADGLLPTVFANLIGNAVKHGGPEVVVTVRVEERDGEVLVSVEDTGPGVPDAVKGKLFTRFERGMARGSGQGLGLFIVRTLVTRYGGRVWVEDRVARRPEKGAAFRLTLKKDPQYG